MVDFINEVEEELRKDDYNKLLKRYGPYLAAIIAAIVLGTGFLEWRKYSQDRDARATSASYTAAVEAAKDGDVDTAVTRLEQLASVAPQGYAGLSLMQAAIAKQEAGDRGAAVQFYDRAAEKFEEARHKQLAQLKAAYILAGDGAYSDVIARISPLAVKDAPYEFLARELLGVAASASGNDALAREQFGYLVNVPGVPPTIKERAEQSLSLMKPVVNKAAEAPETTETTDTPVTEESDTTNE